MTSSEKQNTQNTMIDIAKEFSKYPGGRYVSDGKNSGERFRNEFLVPALTKGTVTVMMDGTLGFGSSFLEEAFGGLIRESGFKTDEVLNKLNLETENDSLKYSVMRYIREARPKSNIRN